MDLCENLNAVGGYSHLLIIQDVLTDYILIYPLKSKTAQEFSKIFLYSVLQNFNIARVHTDNGPVFRNIQWLKLMSSLNIQIINSSAQNPSSRGKAERAVGMVKTLLKKLLATSDNLNWELLPFLVSKIMNHTIVPRTGFKPIQMIIGTGQMSEFFLEKENLTPLHHLIKNDKISVKKLTEEIVKMSDIAKENLIALRQETNDVINKNKIKKQFKENDIVFVLDRYNLPGNSRPLKTKFYASPCVVLRSFYTTTLIQRIADGFRALYSNDDIKKYNGADTIFATLPPEVNKVLLHDFRDMLDSDFKIILENDPLSIPTGITLFDTVEESTIDVDTSDIFLPSPLLQGEGLSLANEVTENNVGPFKNGVGPLETILDVPVLPKVDDSTQVDDSALQNTGLEKDDSSDEDEDNDENMVLRSGKRVKFA